MLAHLLNVREVRSRTCGVVQGPQRNPASHEIALDARVLLDRLGGIAHHQIRGVGIAGVKQLACQNASLNPPFLRSWISAASLGAESITSAASRHLLLVAENVHACEEIAGILLRFRRQ